MGLFRRGRAVDATARQLGSWRGRLGADLWSSDASRQAYFDAAMELETSLAEGLAQGEGEDPVPARPRAQLTELLGFYPPHIGQDPLIQDAASTAFLLARAETWSEFDRSRVDELIDSCCADAGLNDPGSRAGAAAMSVLALYPDRLPVGNREFFPLYDYIVEQPSHQRLAAAGRWRAEMERGIFPADDTGVFTNFDLWYARAWNTGLIIWLFNEHKFS